MNLRNYDRIWNNIIEAFALSWRRRKAAKKFFLDAAKNCSVDIHPTAQIDGRILISGESSLRVLANCILRNVDIRLLEGSSLEIGAGTVLDYSEEKNPALILLNNGFLTIGDYANIKCSIVVRFGGRMEIGARTSIGTDTEIRCQESVTIGRYCLISYDVNIYDTNTHSLDWRERRERIDLGYPHGASEINRPNTRPVVIGDDVWIGKRAIILKGTVLGDRTIVGMGSVVCGKIVPADCKVVSSSVRIIQNY